jgi:hypothetical protein
MNTIMTAMLGFLISGTVNAKEKHHAHEHGKVELDIAIDDKKVSIELESPAESIYGFEHEAKTDVQKKTRDDAVAKLNSDASKFFVFDSKLNCQIVTKSVEPFVVEEQDHSSKGGKKHHHSGGEHSEVHAEFEATCGASPVGTELSVDLGSAFPKMKKVKVQVVGDKSQRGSVLAKGKGKVRL